MASAIRERFGAADDQEILLLNDDSYEEQSEPPGCAETRTPLFHLEGDKKYHVFFSYNSEDRMWARKYVEILEEPPYNLRCCIADRDFLPGTEIIANIEECMKKSMRAILAISPDYLGSAYCDYETNAASEMIQSEAGRAIPVLLRGEKVPNPLRFINYIDARGFVEEKLVLQKLIAALQHGPGERKPPKFFDVVYHGPPPDQNGNEIVIRTEPYADMKHSLGRRWISSAIHDVTDEQRVQMDRMKIKMDNATLAELCKLINQAEILRYHKLKRFRFIYWTLYLFSVVATSVFMFPLVVGMDHGLAIEYSAIFTTVSIPLAVIVCAAVAVCRRLLQIQIRTQTDHFMGFISQHLYRRFDVMVYMIAKEPECCDKCSKEPYAITTYLANHLMDFRDHSSEDRISIARRVIHQAVPGYAVMLRNKDQQAVCSRHYVTGQLPCLCQYIERENLHLITDINLKIEGDEITIPPYVYGSFWRKCLSTVRC